MCKPVNKTVETLKYTIYDKYYKTLNLKEISKILFIKINDYEKNFTFYCHDHYWYDGTGSDISLGKTIQ